MSSNRNEVMQHQINMPSYDNANRYEEVKSHMMGLTLDNDAKYEKLNYNLEGSTEEVVIPDDVPQISPEQENAKQFYYSQMNDMYKGQQHNEIEAFDALYKMGFQQFKLNRLLLEKTNWNIQQCIDVLINHDECVKRFGPNYKNLT